MLAMAVVNHKGGGGGLGRKCVEDEDDILTTLRRLRQTLQECHGRVGLMDQKVEALQPLYKKITTENDMNFRRNNFHEHSFEDYVMEDQCHTQSSKKPTNHVMNGMTNRMHSDVGTLALTNGGGLLLNYHEIMNKGNLYMNDLVQSPSQNPLSALELDLMTLAEKHAKELCDMYHSQSNATNGKNCKKLEQELVTLSTENKKTSNSEEIPRENGQERWEKHSKGGSLQIPYSNGDPPLSINGMKLPEEKNTRRFSKCKEWWSDRLNNLKKPGEELYENGIETNGDEEDSLQEIPNGDVNRMTVHNKFCEQDYFKSYTVSNQDIPKVYRRGKRMLVRTRSIDLEDLPEECEITDLLISESIDDRTKECHDDTLPVVNEMGINRITECFEDKSPVSHEMGVDRTKECHDNTLPAVHEMRMNRTEEYCENRLPNVHEMGMDRTEEYCEDRLLNVHEMGMEKTEEYCEDRLPRVHEMEMVRTKEYCEDRVPNVHEMGMDRTEEYCEDRLSRVHEMGMVRTEEYCEDRLLNVHEMGMDRTEEYCEDRLPRVHEMGMVRTEEYCEDRVPNVHEMGMDRTEEYCEDRLSRVHEMGMVRTDEYCEDRVPKVHEMGMDWTEEYCEDRVTNVHEMGMDRTEEYCEDRVTNVHEMGIDRTKECLQDTLPFVHEMEVETSTENEKKLSEDNRLLTENKINGETRSTEDAVNTSVKVSSNVPVYKIQSSLDVVEKSLDNFKKTISELHDNLKQMNSSEDLALSSCVIPILRNTKEDSGNKSNTAESRLSSDTPRSEHDSKICSCNRKWSYGNKPKGHSCTSKQKILGISDESQRHYKIRGKNHFVVKLSKQRGSEADTVHANKDKQIHHRQYKDSQGWLYKFITFVVFMMLLFFVFYILLTVPIITLSVKHNGGPVPY